MPTLRTVTVKPSGGDYTSLAAAEAGEQGDLVSLDRQLDIECYAMADGTVTFDGWTTDATRYIRVFTPTAERHDGKYNTSKYRIEVTDDNGIICFENFVRFEGLQVKLTASAGSTFFGFRLQGDTTSDMRVSNCLVWGVLSGSAAGTGVAIFGASTTAKLKNNVLWDWTRGAVSSGVYLDNGTALALYNQTIHNCDVGVVAGVANIITAKNCLANDCTDGFSGTFHSNSTNNCSDIASDAPGSNPTSTTDVTFVNEAGDDFHLDAADTVAKDAGADLSADAVYAFIDDIDGQTRSGAWDVGADEIVTAAGPSRDDAAILIRPKEWAG